MSRGNRVALVVVALALLGVFACAVVAVLARIGGDLMPGRGIGVVRIEGVIVSASQGGFSANATVADERVIADLERADNDPSIAAIVLRINSPGGGVVASDEIYRAVKRVEKPVVAYFGETAASGGYYVGCAADLIVAHPDALTGSIGVIMDIVNARRLFDKLGIEMVAIKSGVVKDIGSPYREMTDDERTVLQALVDEAYQNFVDIVAKERGLPREEVLQVADGRVFTGRRAVELGLVDETGSFKDAVRAAADLAGIQGEPRVVEITRQPTLLGSLLSSVSYLGSLLQMDGVSGPRLEYRSAP